MEYALSPHKSTKLTPQDTVNLDTSVTEVGKAVGRNPRRMGSRGARGGGRPLTGPKQAHLWWAASILLPELGHVDVS
jgi:hypothetical protein